MSLKIYNSFSRSKEEFKPINPPYVGMYVCGPTVYGHAHLGHAKAYITFDIIYRYLKYKGYKVRYIQNITDVGHLVGDQDEGEDKIQKQAKLEKQEPVEIAYKYEISYFEDMDALNILRPDISCRATGHIPDMIEIIEKLISKGYAYVTKENNVYFEVRKFKEFGKLSGRKLEDAEESDRIEQAKDKKNPEDFALWKKADANHLMKWNSPWGIGYPGWHIECSVMGMKYIGETLDIHGGGIDNIFPHHECEIAQSEAITGKTFIKYFIHNNILTVSGSKMGKSLGNYVILKDLFKKIDPMVLKFYILQGHYHSPIDFTEQAIDSAKSGYERLINSISSLKQTIKNKETDKNKKVKNEIITDVDKLSEEFLNALDDDFNTPKAIAILFDILKISNNEISSPDPSITRLKYLEKTIDAFSFNIFGLKLKDPAGKDNVEEKLMELIIDLRNNFRKENNFKFSDKIRDELNKIGITLKDGPDGTRYSR